jgi:hypothetical protein
MPAIRRSNCMILGAGYLPFVFASIRPDAAAGVMEIVAT